MSVLDARELRKSYGEKVLLDGASLTIEDGERVGLVGRNGTGKTTLARILAGEEPSDGGTIARRRGASVGYLAQVPVLDPTATAWSIACEGLARWNEQKALWDEATARIEAGDTAERWLEQQAHAIAAIEHLGGWEPQHRVRSLLEHLRVPDVDRAIGTMSGGEQRRVALARLLALEPDLALLDEPTNHLDADTIEWLETYLLDEYRGAILFVTHDRYFLDRIVTRTIELSRGLLHAYDGGYRDYLEAKAERAEHEARAEQNRRNFVRRELEWLRRTPAARTGKQKARIDRAEAAIAQRAPEKERSVTLAMEASRTSKTIVDVRDLWVEIGGRTLVKDLSLSLTKGERVGIVGPNGAGKTTLLRTLLGELPPTRGTVTRGAATQVAYLDQARSGLDPDKTVIDSVANGRLRIEIGGENRDVRGWLDEMMFPPAQQRQPVGSLSGGERARVLTLRMLLSPASLLVLDEPTNDLDTETLSALEDMLVEFDGTALIVTHDRWLLDRVATAILAFEGDGKVVRYAGNWSTYRSLAEARAKALAEEAAAKATPSKPPAPKPAATAPTEAPKKKPLTYAERIELEGLMPAIGEAEAVLAELEREAADPDLFAKRGHEVKERMAAVEGQRAKVAALYARWEELESRSAG
jgi:ATP-binding cassette subfamily F protein uup